MRTVTTTREYDAEGRCVKETVCEAETTDPAPFVPFMPQFQQCLCGTSGFCPLHANPGWWQQPLVSFGSPQA